MASRRPRTVDTGATSGPRFESPYQPPPGNDDLGAQVVDLAERRERRQNTSSLETPTGGHSFRYVVEAAGESYRARMPRPEALHALTSAVSPHVKDIRLQSDMVQLFVANHVLAEDFERILYRMMDPDDSFTKDDLGQLMRTITTLGTARPTVPS